MYALRAPAGLRAPPHPPQDGGWGRERASFGLAVVMAMELSMILHVGPNPIRVMEDHCSVVWCYHVVRHSTVWCYVVFHSVVVSCDGLWDRVMFLELVCTVPMCGISPVL